MKLTDSHCHLDFPEFDNCRKQLISECIASNIKQIIIPSVEKKQWSSVISCCQQSSTMTLHYGLGIHPWYIEQASEQDLLELPNWVNNNAPIAIGEIGLDGQIGNMEKQQHFFEQQLAVAKKSNLPVIIHHRKSHHLILPHLKKAALNRAGVIHGFSGNYQQAKQYLDLGFKLGIGGVISYSRARKTQDTVSKLPLEAILLETDAPSMPLSGFQGQPNSPLQVLAVLEHLVALRHESKATIIEQIEHNIMQLFFNH